MLRIRRNNNLLHELYSPLAAIGSKFAVEARDNAVEYRNTLRRFNEVVKRITVDIEADPETNWRVLKHTANAWRGSLSTRGKLMPILQNKITKKMWPAVKMKLLRH